MVDVSLNPNTIKKKINTITKGTLKQSSAKDLSNGAYAMFVCFLFLIFHNSICRRYSFCMHRQVDAIQMGTHNICLYKEVDKKYTGCNVKTTDLLDCVLTGVCAVIR